MSDIDRMLDDLLDTQPHRSDLRQNIVETFELIQSQLEAARKENSEASDYLGRLLRHCYPELNLLEDLLGRCTQIDNGLAVVVKDQREQLEAAKRELEKLKPNREDFRLTEVDLHRIVNECGSANDLSDCVKDLLLAHYMHAGVLEQLEAAKKEIEQANKKWREFWRINLQPLTSAEIARGRQVAVKYGLIRPSPDSQFCPHGRETVCEACEHVQTLIASVSSANERAEAAKRENERVFCEAHRIEECSECPCCAAVGLSDRIATLTAENERLKDENREQQKMPEEYAEGKATEILDAVGMSQEIDRLNASLAEVTKERDELIRQRDQIWADRKEYRAAQFKAEAERDALKQEIVAGSNSKTVEVVWNHESDICRECKVRLLCRWSGCEHRGTIDECFPDLQVMPCDKHKSQPVFSERFWRHSEDLAKRIAKLREAVEAAIQLLTTHGPVLCQHGQRGVFDEVLSKLKAASVSYSATARRNSDARSFTALVARRSSRLVLSISWKAE